MLSGFRLGAVALAACLVIQTPALAQQPAPAKAPQAKKVCKEEIVTGSVMTKRICHTREEWAQMEARSRSQLDRTRDMDRSKSLVNSSQ